jgi:hypothetical protein
MITSYIGRSRITGAWFGVLIQQTGERHGYSESSVDVDVKYFAGTVLCWNMISVELWVNINGKGKETIRDPANRYK